MTDYDVTPERASHGRVIPDRDLPMVAARWLVDGYDSPLLREMASLTSRQALEREVRLADVLAELGHPIRRVRSPYEELPWRGQWEGIWWAVDRMDGTHRRAHVEAFGGVGDRQARRSDHGLPSVPPNRAELRMMVRRTNNILGYGPVVLDSSVSS